MSKPDFINHRPAKIITNDILVEMVLSEKITFPITAVYAAAPNMGNMLGVTDTWNRSFMNFIMCLQDDSGNELHATMYVEYRKALGNLYGLTVSMNYLDVITDRKVKRISNPQCTPLYLNNIEPIQESDLTKKIEKLWQEWQELFISVLRAEVSAYNWWKELDIRIATKKP